MQLFSLATMVGLAIGSVSPSMQPWVGTALLGAATLIALRSLRGAPRPSTVRAAAFVLGLGLGLALAPPTAPPLLGEHTLRVRVERLDARGATLVDALDRRIHLASALVPGTELSVRGELAPRPGFRNTSPHHPWPSHGRTSAVLRRADVITEIRGPSPYRALVHHTRERVGAALDATLSATSAAVARALVLGDGESIDETSSEAIRGAGLSHVLAVSGMHVTLVVGALYVALRRLLLRWRSLAVRTNVERLAATFAAPVALLYADVAGSTPSAWRAAITAAIAWSLIALDRRPSALDVMAASAIVLATFDPGAALSPAFVLSIAATAAILVPIRVTRAAAPPDEASVAWRISARAFVATAPFTLYVFGGTSWLAVIANLVVVPIASALLLPAALLHAVLATIDPGLASVSAPAVEGLVGAFLATSESFSSLSPSASIPPPDALQGVVLAIASVVALSSRPVRERALALLLLVVTYAGLEVRLRVAEQPHDLLRVTYLDVGQGDAALVDLPDGRLMVIDAGGAPNGGPDPGEHAIVPVLRARRRSSVAFMVLTHPHPDHYGGLAALAGALPIDELWDTGQGLDEHPEGELAAVIGTMVAHGTRVVGPARLCGPPRALAGVTIEVLWPCPRFDPGWDPNDNSLVIRLRYGRRTFAFLGDAEAHAEQALLGRLGHVDVMKVGHHGSRTSSSEALLRELRPHFAVVSSGLGNRFGHPHPEVITRLGAHAASTFRTDLDGSVTITTDGVRLWADTYGGRHARAARERSRVRTLTR